MNQAAQRRFVRHVASTLGAQVTNLLMGLVTAAILARWLGTTGLGIVAVVSLVPTLLSILLSGGIPMANTYFVASGRVGASPLARTSSTLAVVASALGVAVMGILYATGSAPKLLPGIPFSLLVLGFAMFPVATLGRFYGGLLAGQGRIRSVNAVNVLQGATTLIATALLVIVLRTGLWGAIAAPVVAAVVALAAFAWLLVRDGVALRPEWPPSQAKNMLSFGAKGYFANLIQFFNYRLDVFIVNFFLGPTGAGLYSVAVKFAELLWQVPNAVGSVMFPTSAANRRSAMNRFTPRILWSTLALSVLGAFFLAIVGRFAIEVIYTDALLGSYEPLLWLLPGVVVFGGVKVLANDITGRGFPQYNSLVAAVALVATIALDLLLIPRLGLVGASLASTVAYAVSFLLTLFFYTRVTRLEDQVPMGVVDPTLDVRGDPR